jgi:hypothetical protein
MNIVKRLFGAAQAESDASISSPSCLGRAEISQAEAFAESRIKLQYSKEGTTITSATRADATALAGLIDKALLALPQSADLFYAKASAYYAGALIESAEQERRKALSANPEHFDATMIGTHLNTWEHLFQFPAWSEEKTTLPEVTMGRLGKNMTVQVVRDNLKAAILVIFQDQGFSAQVRRMRWEFKWVETPHGFIAAHYLVLDCGPDDTRGMEALLPHAGSTESPSPWHGYWLLQRLAGLEDCFLTLADGNRVVRNKRFTFPRSLQDTMRKMRNQLDRTGPISQSSEARPAAEWHMQHFDVDGIRF